MNDLLADESPALNPATGLVPLEAVLCTGELALRPARAPDYQTENRALVALARSLADAPQSILQKLADTLLEVFQAGSAGISLLTGDGERFFWPAIAGLWQPQIGGGTPRDFGPCGDVLDCDAPLLFKNPERRYPYFLPVTPLAQECLLIPFHVNGKAVGTLWVIAHNERRKFDAEDLRQLESLGRFASAAYQAVQSLDNQLVQRSAALELEEKAMQSRTGREHAENAMRESEAINRSVVESTPDCIKILSLEGHLLAMLSGSTLLGIEDIAPFLNKSWFDFWHGEDCLAAQAAVAAAAAGGKEEFVGFFPTPQGEPKWWNVRVSPIFDANGQPERLLAVSRNVTEQRRREMNLEFLASFSHDLMHWTNAQEMMQSVGAKVGAHLQLSLCAFAEINETAEQVVINHDWHRDDVPGLAGTYRLADFVGQEFIRTARAGEVIVVRDVVLDPRTDPEKFATLKIASFLCVPLVRDGQWRFAMCLYKSAAHDWREDQIELARELTARIWTRLERLRAEAALRESEERFRVLVMASSDVVYRMSPDWSEMRQLHGRSFITDAQVPSRNWLQDYIDPADQPHVMAAINDAIRTRSLFELEHRVRLVDGSFGWTLSHAVPLLDATGDIVEWFGTASDVTAHKQAQQALRESENRYRQLFNSMDEGYCIIEMIFDQHNKPVDWRYLDVNPSFEKMSGLRDAQGKRIRELVPDLEDYWFETYGKVALTGEAVRFFNEVKPLNRWIDFYVFRIGGVESRKVAVLFTNITDRINAEKALRQSEERFRALFDRGPIAMYSCDVSGVIQNFNRCAVDLWGQEPGHGETDDQFRGSFKFYLPGGTLISFAQTLMSKVLRGAVPAVYDAEIVIERPDSTRISVIVNIVPLKDDRGDIQGALSCFYDVTERSRLERKLQEQAKVLTDLDRRKDEFLAMLSHELRNPLAALSNAVHMLRLQKNEEPVQRQARSVIERQVAQLKHLVDDLLEISRITTGRVQLRRERIALGGIVERAIETVQPLVERRRHELTVSLPPQLLWLQADAARLEQVVVNLLTNASKYTDEGGSIWVEVQQEGDEVVLRVRDTGIGIAPELLPRIFDLFTQAERSLDRSQGGLGIGLCLVQRLVDLHGGTVAVSSVLGQGSEFVVRLPAMPMDLLRLPPPLAATETAHPPGTGCRVLVVDDNVDAAQTLSDLLEATGHVVRMTHDGLAALEVLQEFQADLVLLDIGLPGLTGLEVAKRIRGLPERGDIVLAAMTGYGQDTDRQRSKEAGFDHHLVKPADFDEVEKILASVGGGANRVRGGGD